MRLVIISLIFLVYTQTSALAAIGDFWKEERPVVGWVEKVKLEDAGFVVKARMDTGAGMASVDAEIIKIEPSKDPSKLGTVTFTIRDADDQPKVLKREIVEWQEIKRKGGKGYMKRPVVKMKLCIAGKKILGRVNLADRANFLYPVLIGRNILKTGDFMIDPTKKFVHRPTCR